MLEDLETNAVLTSNGVSVTADVGDDITVLPPLATEEEGVYNKEEAAAEDTSVEG